MDLEAVARAEAVEDSSYWLDPLFTPQLAPYTVGHSGLGSPKSIINQEMLHRLAHRSV